MFVTKYFLSLCLLVFSIILIGQDGKSIEQVDTTEQKPRSSSVGADSEQKTKVLDAKLSVSKDVDSLNRLKIITEIEKTRSEIERIKKDTDDSFTLKEVVQFVFGGFVAAGLFVAWFISYMKPIQEKNIELSKLQKELNELTQQQNELKFQESKRENEIEIKRMTRLNEELDQRLSQAIEKSNELKEQLDELNDINSEHFIDTTWDYRRESESAVSKKLKFKEDGVVEIIDEIVNDITEGEWKINGDEIEISFNERYSVYQAKIVSRFKIEGKAYNKLNENWNWNGKKTT